MSYETRNYYPTSQKIFISVFADAADDRKILDGDLTLREKVKLIFREQVITNTAVLTVFE